MVNRRFGAAICVSPTSCLDCMTDTDKPNQFACIPRKFHYDLSENSLDDIIDMIKDHQKKMRREGRIQEILLVLDDILTSNHSGRLEAFTSWISIKRHYMCSIVAIMQTATAIPPSARRQVNGAFFSRPLMWQDKQIMQEWYLCRQFRGSKRETMSYAAGLMDEVYAHSPYAFLYVNASSKATNVRETVRVALAPSGKVKKFKLKFKKPKGKRGKKKMHNNDIERDDEQRYNLEETYDF